MRKKLSVIWFVLFGWMIGCFCVVAFVSDLFGKILMCSIFGLLAGAFLLVGAVTFSGNRKRATGLAFFLGSGGALFILGNLYQVSHNPLYRDEFPSRNQVDFSDFQTGFTVSGSLLIIGILFFLFSLKKKRIVETVNDEGH